LAAKDVNWTEGLFVQPHHFQQAFHCLEEQVGAVLAECAPHFVGVSRLKFSENDCENYIFHLEEIECRFPSGALVRFPGNAAVASRDFKEQMDANQGRLEVYLGLPKLSDQEPNCLRFDETPLGGAKYRYISKMESVNDVVAGGNAREIEVKQFNPKVLFSGESTFGYETVRIATLARSGQYGSTPQPDKRHVPPCVSVAASPALQNIIRETGNRLAAKNRALRDYWKSKDTAAMMKARDAFKVQTLAWAANGFAQFAGLARAHPFPVYCKMVEIIGMLSIYSENDRDVEAPVYDHDKLGECFHRAEECLVKLLSLLEEASYEARVFELAGELLRCPIEPAWFAEKNDLYICFEAQLDETQVGEKVRALKAGPENLIDILNQRRIRGMNLEGPLHHLPHLPTSPNHHYFKIPRDATYFPKLRENPVLAVWGPHQFAELTTLYVVERNKK